MKAMDSNWLDTQLQNPIDLKRAMHMKFGYMETSFFDDITKNKNEYSSGLYADLLRVTDGDVLTGGITDGMVDTDGEEGISAQEAMNTENYEILTGNLIGMKDPEVTKAYFKDYTIKEFEKANNYGHGNKPPKPASKTGGGGGKDGGHVGSSMGGVGWVPGSKKQEYRGYIDKFADFQGNYGNYKFDVGEGKYYDANADAKVFMTAYDVAQKEDAAKGDPSEDFFYSPDSAANVELNEEQSKGLATWDMLDFDDDNAAAAELNDWFFPKGSKSVEFVPYARWHQRGLGIKDARGTNDIMIINPVSEKPYKDENGDVYRFSTDGDQNALQSIINSINSNPIINPFVKPRTKPNA